MSEAGVIPRPEDRDPLHYPCDFCGAPPGEPCVNTVFRDCPMTISHYSRTPLAVREADG